jgi:hypothetical protein
VTKDVGFRSHLLVLGERVAIRWVLTSGRTAFPEYRAKDAAEVSAGDELLLYTTRGAFHNPGYDRGRVIGRARAMNRPEPLAEVVTILDKEYAIGCDLQIESLAPRGHGVELAPVIPDLDAFRHKPSWGMALRRPLVLLTAEDADRLFEALRPRLTNVDEAIKSYL